MGSSESKSVRYFCWEGDACRIHADLSGGWTGDLYRGGKGHLPVSPVGILFGAREIGRDEYDELVGEEDDLRHAKDGSK